jgi:hypothetical protein
MSAAVSIFKWLMGAAAMGRISPLDNLRAPTFVLDVHQERLYPFIAVVVGTGAQDMAYVV